MKLEKIMSVVRMGLVIFLIVSCGCPSLGPEAGGTEAGEYRFGELTRLADKYQTDKGSNLHSYTEVYEYYFYPIKNKATKIFEIGVLKGASMKMLRDYFPNAVIYGIDIIDTSELYSPTIRTFIADQSNRKQLETVMYASGGGFDIIIDDGGHMMDLQQISFGALFKYLKPGGYYIIEDVHTSIYEFYGSEYGAEENGKNTTLFMIDNFIRNGKIKSKYMTREEEDYLTANIKYCSLLSRHRGRTINCIFKKK